MSPENLAKANANVRYINSLTSEELDKQLKSGKCPYEPEHLIGVPLGMFHCEVCGVMVVAGMSHPPIVWNESGHYDYPDNEP